MSLLIVIISLLYILFIFALVIGFRRVKPFHLKEATAINRFSIVVPFRNEERHLNKLITSLTSIDYPNELYEILLVDDESEDDSTALIKRFIHENQTSNVYLISSDRRGGSPKKEAIETGIKQSKNEWIVTTDADCIHPKNWLSAIDQFINETGNEFIIGPLGYSSGNGLIGDFQRFDNLSLQCATAGSYGLGFPFLCNGANLVFSKSLFYELHGYQGNECVAGGDDLFFLGKVLKHKKESIGLISSGSARVLTVPEPTWTELLVQRKRWASKTAKVNHPFSIAISLIVTLTNFLIIIGFILWITDRIETRIFLGSLIAKFLADFICIAQPAIRFRQNLSPIKFLVSFLIYPIFVMATIIYSIFPGFSWKDRYHRI